MSSIVGIEVVMLLTLSRLETHQTIISARDMNRCGVLSTYSPYKYQNTYQKDNEYYDRWLQFARNPL